ncbi:MAG: dockerin type I repeat-containing protein, partial [Ruminococcus sp.]
TIIDETNVFMTTENDKTYASKSEITGGNTPTVPTDPTNPADSTIIGDADGNGIINVKDATAIQKHVAGIITLTNQELANADFNADGVVNVKDATAVQKKVAGII